MLKGKKTLITRQRFERIVIRQLESGGNNISCFECGSQKAMLPIEKAGLACGISSRGIFRLMENGQVHFAELPSGPLFVCIASLQAEQNKSKQ